MNEILERYYTSDIVSNTLISLISCKKPRLILDLGVGDASLTKAAFLRWSNASYIGVDVDSLNIDAFSKGFIEKIGLGIGNVDIAICNPPYSKSPNLSEEEIEYLIGKSNLLSFKYCKKINTEILFLMYNLSMLKTGGHLGIILPDGIFTNNSFNSLRKEILEKNTVTHVVELPEKTFSKTEAKTHILILKKGTVAKKTNSKVTLLKLEDNGEVSKPIRILEDHLIKRMDYRFHSRTMSCKNGDSLEKIGIQIFRGRKSNKELKNCRLNHFHTTDFKKHLDNEIIFPTNTDYAGTENRAQEGDILIARVGKRIVGKWAFVKGGESIVSDCVFIVRVPSTKRKRLLNYLSSSNYEKDIEVLKHGVCSLLISKTDLLKLKIPKSFNYNQ